MIKPEFFDDPVIADLTPMARLFFIGLWLQADRAGRLTDDTKRLKARIFPYDAVDCENLANELTTLDLVRRYAAPDGKKYIWIRTFEKHQRPHPKEPKSLIPAIVEINGKPCLKTEGTPESGFLILDSGTRNLDITPLPPSRGLNRAEIKAATEIRAKVYGGCPHTPRCDKFAECVKVIALARRAS